MKNVRGIFVLMLLVFSFCSCKKDEVKIIKQKVTGQVQKGPFVNGTSITMSELNSSLVQTGKIFTTQIINNTGSFEIDNINLTSGYVEFSASGYYFDEVKGDLSMAPLTLIALSDIKDISTVNVNILTYLEKQRVEYLTQQNKTFSEAKKTAQKEILGIFGFSPSSINNSENLDISVNSDANAALLAISVILQGNRSVAALTELLASISNDLKEDGKLNDETIMTGLRNSTKELVLTSIRSNLEKRYQNLGVSATIPGFEKYVNDFLAYTGEKPSTTTEPVTEITTTSATFNGTVNPNSLSTIVYFEWGKTTSYSDSIPAVQSPVTGSLSVNVSSAVTGLLPGTTYHFRIKTRNSLGTTYGNDLTFTTLGQIPSASTEAATDMITTSATLHGKVNANLVNTTVFFEWGETTGYGDSIPAIQNPVTGNTSVNVSAGLTGLTEETTYHFRLKAINLVGIKYGEDRTFTTAGRSPITLVEPATIIQTNSATLNGSINANSIPATVTFEWGTTTNYGNTNTALQSPVTAGTLTAVSTEITGLTPGTTYHFRITAINEFKTKISDDLTFTTLAPITDIDGNVYNIRTIGSQIWMTENLKTTRYNNGDLIGTTLTPTLNIDSESTPKYQWAYDGDESNVLVYGRLYTWYTATDPRNICPTGWHVPTDDEWTVLSDYLTNNGYGFEGSGNDIARSMAATSLWHSDENDVGSPGNDIATNNSSGFTGLPSGVRVTSTGGMNDGETLFSLLSFGTFWWTSSAYLINSEYRIVYSRNLNYCITDLFKQYGNPVSGYSVRCMKN
jgi:uncharacterized protein (TIGR02145 family)